MMQGKWSIVDVENPNNNTDTLTDWTFPILYYYLKKEVNYVEFTNDNKTWIIGKKSDTLETDTYFVQGDSLLTLKNEKNNNVSTLIITKSDDGLIKCENQENGNILTLKKR